MKLSRNLTPKQYNLGVFFIKNNFLILEIRNNNSILYYSNKKQYMFVNDMLRVKYYVFFFSNITL